MKLSVFVAIHIGKGMRTETCTNKTKYSNKWVGTTAALAIQNELLSYLLSNSIILIAIFIALSDIFLSINKDMTRLMLFRSNIT